MAAVAWLLAGAWCWRREVAATQPARMGNRTSENYQPAVSVARPVVTGWEPPVAQPAGAAWIFEVFSPPLIHRDAGTKKFAAGSPETRSGDRLDPDIKLLAVRAAPYRVQFQGGFGGAGGYVAALVSVGTQEVWCARPGERWAEMGLVLERMDVGIAAVSPDDHAAQLNHFPHAVVRDELTGERVTLVSGVQTLSREFLATIRLPNRSKTKNLREGDTWRDGDCTYRVDRLSMDPVVEAVVTKIGPGGQVDETWLLRPNESDAGDPGNDVPAEPSSRSQSSYNAP